MGEIIRVEVTAVDGDSVTWVDVVSGRHGSGTGAAWLAVGDEAVIEVEQHRGRHVVTRVLQPLRVPAESPASDPPALLVNGVPVETGDPTTSAPSRTKHAIEVGDVRPALIPFSAFNTADRDRGSVGKRRPSVVVAIEDAHVAVQPIFGTNSAIRRNGAGIRLRDWRQIGLRKSSVVSLDVSWVAPSDIGPLIGTLSEQDRRRVLGDG